MTARHPACTCGLYDEQGRYSQGCTYHQELNARLEAAKDPRPFAVRQAQAQANVAAWEARHVG